jgi:hypothetical protein
MANTAKNDSAKIRRKLAADLRLAGMSHPEIAVVLSKKLGQTITAERVKQDIRVWLNSCLPEDVNTVRDLEVQRLDKGIALAMRMIAANDPKGVDALVKLQDRRSKYLGLDHTPAENNYSMVDDWLADITKSDLEFDPKDIGLNEDDTEMDDEIEDLPDDEEEPDLE